MKLFQNFPLSLLIKIPLKQTAVKIIDKYFNSKQFTNWRIEWITWREQFNFWLVNYQVQNKIIARAL